jgi:hypothetical protein
MAAAADDAEYVTWSGTLASTVVRGPMYGSCKKEKGEKAREWKSGRCEEAIQ